MIKHVSKIIICLPLILFFTYGIAFSQCGNVLADAGDPQTVELYDKAGKPAIINLSGDDSYGAITYKWKQTEGSKVDIKNADTSNASFTPTKKGKYVFRLEVLDEDEQSAWDSVTITVI